MTVLLDALAGSFCQRFALIPFICLPDNWMPWPEHFAKGFLSCLFICLPDDCFAGCLGSIILPKVCFHCFSLFSQMIAVLETWLDHFARGLLSFLFICLPHDCFAGWLGRIILPKVSLHFFSLVSHMVALLDALAGSFCHRFVFISFHLSCT